MGSDAVAGVIIDLSIEGAGQLADASDRVSAKLRSVGEAGDAARKSASDSAAASESAKKAFGELDTRLEVSFQKLRRVASVLTRLAKKAAEDLGDEEAAAEIEVTGHAIGSALTAGRIATQVATSVAGPEVGVPVGLIVAASTFAYEETVGLQALNEKNADRARQIAREEISAREKVRHEQAEAFDKAHSSYLEDQARERAQVAKLNAALGGGGLGQ